MIRVARLPGDRLHLQHGPIDLVIGAEGSFEAAFAAAEVRFGTVLDELMADLPLLRQSGGACPAGEIAQAMWQAVRPHAPVFVTPMAAVAGAVAQTVLAAMLRAAPLRRAYVNNGGDIALHLGSGEIFALAMAGLSGSDLGRVMLRHNDGIGGVATSGRGGRSLTLGIADSVTVLAATAAGADAAATLIANAVDLPGHPGIERSAACDLRDDSDLGTRLVVTGVAGLSRDDVAEALGRGLTAAQGMERRGLIRAAALTLGGQGCVVGAPGLIERRSLQDA